MGLFSKKPKEQAAPLIDLYAYWDEEDLAAPEDFDLDVVGESYCRDHLVSLVKSRSAEEQANGEFIVFAQFVPDPANKFDPNAIGVWIDGGRVGYIQRDDTGDIHELLEAAAAKGGRLIVLARVGWDAQNPNPAIGVRLALPSEDLSVIDLLTAEEMQAKSLRARDV